MRGWRLYLFGGGWVIYDLHGGTTSLFVNMAGVGAELLLGAGLLWVRRAGHWGALVKALAAVLLLHGGWYLGSSVHEGYGDGSTLYRLWGVARLGLSLPVFVACTLGAFFLARQVVGPYFGVFASASGVEFLKQAAAPFLAAGMLHAALTFGEYRWHTSHDETYLAIMESENQKLEKHLDTDATLSAAEKSRILEERRPFAYGTWLVLAMCASLAAGAVSARRDERGPAALHWRDVAEKGAWTLAALAGMILLKG